ncbi:MAG: SpoIIE family protein phosphatase [Spirochaetes bacterium]|nr:SpoIIE family protein phosphatase [Spirochaetota bacterium]
MKFGDNKRYASPEYDASDWHTVLMPGSLTRYILDGKIGGTTLEGLGKIYGVCWLRKSVFIGENVGKESLGLILGRIGNADETFFNGVKIGGMGEFPPHEFSMWNHPRHYLIPKSLIRYGEENVISVRISYYVYCEMVGTLAITNFEDWRFDSSLQNFIRVTMNYVIIFMGVPLVLMFMLFFIRKRDQEYLFYSLQLVCGLFIVLDTCDYFFWDTFGNTLWRLKVLGLSWVALNVTHPIFLHRIYGLRRKRIEIGLWAFLVFNIILMATVTGKTSDRFQAITLIALTTPIGLYNLSCHVSALVKRSPDAKLFAIFGCTVILGAIHDGFVYFPKFGGFTVNLFGYTPENFIFGYSAAALYIGTALLLIQRLIKMMNNLDEMNSNLENKVQERTGQLTMANEELRQAMEEVETINEELVKVNRDLKTAEYRHERDVAMAVNMQSAFLPGGVPFSEKYDIAFVYKPMEGISGDFYDFYESGGDIEGVGIFDVSGHGIASGLITLMSKSIVYGNFIHMKGEKLNRVFDSINRKLIKEFGHIDNYLTGILIRFDNDRMEYVNSGHPDLMYRSSRTGKVGRVLDRDGNSISGPFMGTRDMERPYTSLTIKINRGDCFLLYTDCLLETGDAEGNIYDESKIIESLKNAPAAGAQEILDYILGDFYAFAGKRDNFKDDLTAILIRRK